MAGYEIPDDDIGIVKVRMLQVIREAEKQPAGKILRENINVYRGTKHLPSILQDLCKLLNQDILNSKEHEDFALFLQGKILELRKKNPGTFSWIPVNLETDEIYAFFLALRAKLHAYGAKVSACSIPELNQHGYNAGDDQLNPNQHVSNINTTEINTPLCTTTSHAARDNTNQSQTLTHITTSSSIQAADVSDSVAQSLMTTSTPPVRQMGVAQNLCATTTENVLPNYNVVLLTGESFTNLPMTGNSPNTTKRPSLPQQETADQVSSQITSLEQNTSLSAQKENGSLAENMTYSEINRAMASHSDTLSAQLPQVYSGASLTCTSAREYTSDGTLMQSLSEQQSVAALLSLASATQVDSSYQTDEINNSTTVGRTSTVTGVTPDASENQFALINDYNTPPTAQILYGGTRVDIADSSQEAASFNTDERDICAPETMPLTGEQLKQDISCLSKSKTTKKQKTRCQYCDYLDEADIGLYKDIRGMSQVRKEQTIRTYIKSAPTLRKGKGKRQLSNEYYLPYQDGKRRRVCRETFEKYFKTCRNTISKVTKKCQQEGDCQTWRDVISTETQENQQEGDDTDCSSVVQTALKKHIKRFLSDQLKLTAVNGNYCKMEWKYLHEMDLHSNLYVYNQTCEREMKVDEELFKEVMESVNIRVWGDDDERLYWYGVCRICDLLENSAAGESSEQQLKQHQEDADRMNRYCDRVMTTQEEQGVLYVYMDVDITDRHLYNFRHFLLLYCVTLIDLKSKVASHFMWEFVRAGFGDQHLLSCLKRYLERRLAESPVRRIVLITKPYGGLLRNTDLIGLFLWVMARYGVIDVQVVYEYYGHNNFSLSDLIDPRTIRNISMKYITSDPMMPLQQLLIDQDNHHLITCMTPSDMLNFINTKAQVSATNWETVQVSLNTTRWLHVTRHESMCDVIMTRRFSDAADDAGRSHVTEFRVPLPPAETVLTPLYPSGYRLPAEWYRWVMEDGFSQDKEYFRTHVQVDESDTRKVLPHPRFIIQETDGLEEEDH